MYDIWMSRLNPLLKCNIRLRSIIEMLAGKYIVFFSLCRAWTNVMVNFLDPVRFFHNTGYYFGLCGFRILSTNDGKIRLQRNPIQLVCVP